jgi:hypothetical protein
MNALYPWNPAKVRNLLISVRERRGRFSRIGPWFSEPDAQHWIDPDTSYACAIIRHAMGGHLLGYVGLPIGHALYNKNTEQLDLLISVHGGISYVKRGEDNDFYWIGFDCGHVGDDQPGYSQFSPDDVYRTISYVRKEVISLAKQLCTIGVLEKAATNQYENSKHMYLGSLAEEN